MYINLSGMYILLTGASHDLGQAIAVKLGEAGATVALQANKRHAQAEELAYALSNGSRSFQADLGDKAAGSKLFDKVVEEFGEIEVLINNASVFMPSDLSLPDDQWRQSWQQNMAVNFGAVVDLCKRAVDYWVKKKRAGRIINIILRPDRVSGSGGEELAYLVSKAALEAFVYHLSIATHGVNVKAFTVLPPPIGGKKLIDQPASKQVVRPRGIAPLVTFLCSGLADHASGTTIDMRQPFLSSFIASMQASSTTP